MVDGSQRALFENAEGVCCRCGTAEYNREPVTWLCAICGRRVCPGCTLTDPNSDVLIYFDTTYCSTDCREVNAASHRLGKPIYPDDQLYGDLP